MTLSIFLLSLQRKRNMEDKTMANKKESEKAADMKILYNDLINLLLKRAGIKAEDVYETAMKSWASKNLDLLTPTERRKYHGIIMQ